jgi:surfeit locus 1 family protein
MRRPPLFATLIVAAAVATMIGLGIWQLQRARWKEALLTELAVAPNLPVVDLDPLLERGGPLPPLAFRRVLVSCEEVDVAPEVRAGRSAAGVPGQVYLVPCRPGADGEAGRIRINAGWAKRPDAARRLTLRRTVAGRLGGFDAEGPLTITSATPLAPLAPSAPVTVESVPNNHLSYAFQWFFFAAAASLIYALALRRRRPDPLPPEP